MSYIGEVRVLIGGDDVWNNTWGHYAPHKNTSYKGFIRVMNPHHGGNNGWGMTLLEYNLAGLDSGPYIHDAAYKFIDELDQDQFEQGAIYDIPVTFRNYRIYSSKPILRLKSIELNGVNRAN